MSEGWENLEEAFKELDGTEFLHYANALAAYRKALLSVGFGEAITDTLVKHYSKFLYKMTFSEAQFEQRRQEALQWLQDEQDLGEDDDVDLEGDY